MRTISVKKDQSLFDIALQEYGDVEGVFWLVTDNKLNGVTSNVFKDQELLIRDEVINRNMKEYLSQFDIATVKGARGIGIGYWQIGGDFKVS